jgi:hypothetical protein
MPAHTQPPQRATAKSFREFALLLKRADPSLNSFVAHLTSEPLPNVNSWTEVRSYLTHSGAEHDAFVGGRMAWREYKSLAKGDGAS